MKLLTLLAVLSLPFLLPAAEAPKELPPKVTAASPELQADYAKLAPAQKARLTRTINTGDQPAVEALPGIGPVRAAAIIAARPHATALDLLKVPGIGAATLKQILLTAAQDLTPVAEPKKKSKKAAPPEKKTPDPKKE